MADHNNLVSFYIFSNIDNEKGDSVYLKIIFLLVFQPIPDTGNDLVDQAVKEKLRKVLKRMGKLKCSKEVWTYFTIKMSFQKKNELFSSSNKINW